MLPALLGPTRQGKGNAGVLVSNRRALAVEVDQPNPGEIQPSFSISCGAGWLRVLNIKKKQGTTRVSRPYTTFDLVPLCPFALVPFCLPGCLLDYSL